MRRAALVAGVVKSRVVSRDLSLVKDRWPLFPDRQMVLPGTATKGRQAIFKVEQQEWKLRYYLLDL